jgi:hypothetical protein
MPLTLRTVEPTDVSLNRIPAYTPGRRIDELQCVANGTLANMMRQLGTLSAHGAQLFEDLNKSLEGIDRRLEALGLRSTNLQEKIQMGAGASQDGKLNKITYTHLFTRLQAASTTISGANLTKPLMTLTNTL